MNGHELRRQRKRKEILSAAIKLFLQHGMKHVSISHIAKKAGASRVTIYKHFETKSVLIHESLRMHFHDLASDLADLLHSDKSYEEKLFRLFAIKSASIQGFGGELSTWLQTEDRCFVEDILDIRRKSIEKTVIPFLEAGRKAGEIQEDMSNDVLLAYIDILGVGMAYSHIYSEYEKRNPLAFSEIQNIALGVLLQKSNNNTK